MKIKGEVLEEVRKGLFLFSFVGVSSSMYYTVCPSPLHAKP